jgi:cell division protein FtsZ
MGGGPTKDAKEPDIAVVGCGGSGNNTVHHLSAVGNKDLRPIAINTDKVHIELVDCPTKVLIGEDLTHGLGAAGCPEIGEECALKAKDELSAVLGHPDIVFVVAGLGGGTGTGASVVVAKIAKENGAFVIAVVSMPFSFEGRRKQVAEKGLENLKRVTNCVIVIDNDRLMEIGGNLPVDEAFSIIDHLIAGLIDNMSRNITLPKQIKADVPLEVVPIQVEQVLKAEEEFEPEEDMTEGQKVETPPLVTVDMSGMAEIMKSDDTRAAQGKKMGARVANDLKIPVELPKKSNVLISETRPLTLLPFLMPQVDAEAFTDGNDLKAFIEKNGLNVKNMGANNGGEVTMKQNKERKESDKERTVKPMTQMRLDNIWV